MQFYLLFFEATQWSCTSNYQQLFFNLENFLDYSFNLSFEFMFNSFWNPDEFPMKFLKDFLCFFDEFIENLLWIPGQLFLSFSWNPWKQISNLREKPLWISFDVPMDFLCFWRISHEFPMIFLRISYEVLTQFFCGF